VGQDAAYVVGFPPDAVALAPASELFSSSCAEAKREYVGEVEVQVTALQPPPPSSSHRPDAKRRRIDASESTIEALAAEREIGIEIAERGTTAAVDWRCDGWLGYFTSTLWDGIAIDSRHCQTTRNRCATSSNLFPRSVMILANGSIPRNKSLSVLRRDSFHWEAFLFPLREAIPVPWLRSTQQGKTDAVQLQTAEAPTNSEVAGDPMQIPVSNCLQFKLRRCCESTSALVDAETGNAVSSEKSCFKLWYEWRSHLANVRQVGEWHNANGESQALSLQSPEHRQACPPPLDTPDTDPKILPAAK
jgi:hypothetical protein